MDLELSIFGDVQLRRKLLRFGEKAQDASDAFEEIADQLRLIEREQFDSEGGFASAGWAPLAPSTILRKLSRGQPLTILEATGRLRRSLTGEHDPGHVEIVGPQQLVFGTQVPYAHFHQTGTSQMPRRRPVELRETDRRQVVRILQRHLVSELR